MTDAESALRYTLTLDIRYGICYNQLQRRLLSRADKAIKIVEVLLGSTAFVSFFNHRPEFAGLAGLALAVIGAIKLAVDFGALAALAETQCQRFSDLLLIADALSIGDLIRQLKVVQAGDAPEIEALRLPAFNKNLVEQGRNDFVVRLSWRERVMEALT